MAEKIHAVAAYAPKIILGPLTEMDEVIDYVASRTGLNRGEVRLVLGELHDTVLHFNRSGRPVKFEGLGIYTPTVKLSGTYAISHRIDRELRSKMNDTGVFTGKVKNSDMMEKTMADLIARWNEEHPDDPIVIA
jgi:nucleoid DNA-binding protein